MKAYEKYSGKKCVEAIFLSIYSKSGGKHMSHLGHTEVHIWPYTGDFGRKRPQNSNSDVYLPSEPMAVLPVGFVQCLSTSIQNRTTS